LLENGANPNEISGRYRSTALEIAVGRNYIKIAELLLTSGADVNLTAFSISPIRTAIKYGYVDMIKLLMSYGANINVVFDAEICTGVHIAVLKNNTELLKVLVEYGVDINQKNVDGSTPLYYAAKYSYISCAKYLIQQGALINLCNKIDDTPLCIAAYNGNHKMCELLIQHGANPDIKCEKGFTAIEWANIKGYKTCAEIIKKTRDVYIINMLSCVIYGIMSKLPRVLSDGNVWRMVLQYV
jgi:ankyrin repeat protein